MLTVEVSSNENVSFKQIIKSSFQEIEQQIEASYNQLNDSIDKIFASTDLSAALMSTPSINISFKTLEIPSNLKFLQNEIIQEIRPLIKKIVQNEVQIIENQGKINLECNYELVNQVVNQKNTASLSLNQDSTLQQLKMQFYNLQFEYFLINTQFLEI